MGWYDSDWINVKNEAFKYSFYILYKISLDAFVCSHYQPTNQPTKLPQTATGCFQHSQDDIY